MLGEEGKHCLLGRLDLKLSSWFYFFADFIITPPVVLWNFEAFTELPEPGSHLTLKKDWITTHENLKGISSLPRRKTKP